MKRNAKNDVDALESIGIALGVRGASKKRCEATAHKLFARNRGKPIDLQTRQNVAMLLLLGELSYRSIAKQCRVSLGSITNIKKRSYS
jgi:hypothetical protein